MKDSAAEKIVKNNEQNNTSARVLSKVPVQSATHIAIA
jgi:hypothetical protein